MNIERNRFLTEAMNECWHEFLQVPKPFDEGTKESDICAKCGEEKPVAYNNFSTPDGFFKLWSWAQKQEWWADVVRWDFFIDEEGITNGANFIQEAMIDPDRFADAVYQFLKEKI
jgi:hypothetical protein